MNDDQQTKQLAETPPATPPADSWAEAGRQFQALGEKLAAAFRSTWNDPDTQQHVGEMRQGLETMMHDVHKAIHETNDPANKAAVRQDVRRTAESVRAAGVQTWQEVGPQVVAALHQLNKELQQLLTRVETHPTPPAEPPAGPAETRRLDPQDRP